MHNKAGNFQVLIKPSKPQRVTYVIYVDRVLNRSQTFPARRMPQVLKHDGSDLTIDLITTC
jgi:hypothetical protein